MKNKIFYGILILIIIFSLTGVIILNKTNKKETEIADPESNLYKNAIGDITNYHSKKIIMYVFYGNGCKKCEEMDSYIEEITKDFKEYVEIKRYEVWDNEKNSNIYMDVAKHFKIEEENYEIPLIVIGENYFTGSTNNAKLELKKTLNDSISSTYNIFNNLKYKDVVKGNNDKLTLYLFYGKECPHCEDERKLLDDLQKRYSDYLTIELYETWHNNDNAGFMQTVKNNLNVTSKGVPFTVIGEDYFSGYSDTIGKKIESSIIKYIKVLNPDYDLDEALVVDENTEDIPFLGKINVKNASIITMTIILGFIDGFNPCAMWVLIFLIGMLFNMEDKKRMWILGYTFLFASSIFYFFAVFFLDVIVGYMTVKIIRYLIGVVGIIGGLYNLYKYYTEPKDGCSTTSNTEKKKIMTKIRKFTSEKNIFLALIGVIVLAVSVNLVEIMCTTGFPTIFVSILELNNITGVTKIIYLLVYILMYMIDDLVVFIVSMVTLEVTGISTKYNRLSHLVGGILMVLIGILLIFKYEWLMFNF